MSPKTVRAQGHHTPLDGGLSVTPNMVVPKPRGRTALTSLRIGPLLPGGKQLACEQEGELAVACANLHDVHRLAWVRGGVSAREPKAGLGWSAYTA